MRTLEEPPEGATHWSRRELARQVGISPASVHRIWRAFGLQPWRTEDFKISRDPGAAADRAGPADDPLVSLSGAARMPRPQDVVVGAMRARVKSCYVAARVCFAIF